MPVLDIVESTLNVVTSLSGWDKQETVGDILQFSTDIALTAY